MKKAGSFQFAHYIFFLALVAFSCQSIEDTSITPAEVVPYLTFESPSELYEYVTNKSNITSGRFLDQPKREFVSFGSVVERAFSELDNASTESEFESILRNYQDVIVIRDSAVVPLISASTYSRVCNRARIYVTGDRANKVIDDEYIVSSDISDLNKLSSINSILNLPKSFTLIQYSQGLSNAGRTKAGCGSSFIRQEYFNPSGCRNDRKVFIEGRLYYQVFSYVGGGNRYLPWAEIEVYGARRNGFWCVWVLRYKTLHNFRNISFSVLSFFVEDPSLGWTTPGTAIRAPLSLTFRDSFGTTEERYRFIYNGRVGAWLDFPWGSSLSIVSPPFEFIDRTNLEASTRGTNNQWAHFTCP
jgi:hypothetical protein